jgi:formylglycine-generating enzyme required for sulfatase activity
MANKDHRSSFEETLAEVRKIDRQLDEILELTAKYSEKVSSVGNKLIETSSALGAGAVVAAQEIGKHKGARAGGQALKAGGAAAGALALVGLGVKKASEMYNEYKQKKLRREAMEKKKEIAEKKNSFVERQIPKLEKSAAKVQHTLKQDSSQTFDIEDWDRYHGLVESIGNHAEGYVKAVLALQKARFLHSEFQAWLQGNWESDWDLPKESEILRLKVQDTLESSKVPTNCGKYEIPAQLSAGTLYLMSNKSSHDQARRLDPQFRELTKEVTRARARAKIWPFGEKKEYFNKFYDEFLQYESHFERRSRSRITAYIIALMCALGATGYAAYASDLPAALRGSINSGVTSLNHFVDARVANQPRREPAAPKDPAEKVENGAAGPKGSGEEVPGDYKKIPAGSFEISASGSRDTRSTTVRISNPFMIRTSEVTQRDWQSQMGYSVSYFEDCGQDCPVESVNWYEALRYVNRLSESAGLPTCYQLKNCDRRPSSESNAQVEGQSSYRGGLVCGEVEFKGLSCRGYRLPTSAEWQYAARGNWRHVPDNLALYAWFEDNSHESVQPVGTKSSNSYGLYDTLGNVWEWTTDTHRENQGNRTPIGNTLIDPSRTYEGKFRSIAGGSWNRPARKSTFNELGRAYPDWKANNVGFRPVRTIENSD